MVRSVAIGVAVLLAAGCGGSTGQTGATAESTREAYAPRVVPAGFTTAIDNECFPLSPGTTFDYEKRGENPSATR